MRRVHRRCIAPWWVETPGFTVAVCDLKQDTWYLQTPTSLAVNKDTACLHTVAKTKHTPSRRWPDLNNCSYNDLYDCNRVLLVLDFHLTRLRDIKLAGKYSSLSVGVRVFLKEISAWLSGRISPQCGKDPSAGGPDRIEQEEERSAPSSRENSSSEFYDVSTGTLELVPAAPKVLRPSTWGRKFHHPLTWGHSEWMPID